MSPARRVVFSDGMCGLEWPGPGETVFWVHGYTLRSSLWGPMWRQLPDWRHVGIDWLRRLPPGASASLPVLGRAIARIAVEQGARHLVGLSFGAILALQAAAEQPRAFATLTLGSAGLTGGPEAEHARQRYIELIQAFRQRGAGPWLTEIWMRSPPHIFSGAAAHPRLWRDLAAAIDRHPWRELESGLMQRLTQYRQVDHLDVLARTGAATLLLVGEHEMPAFRQAAELIQTTLPHCVTVDLPATGHLCLLEAPAESATVLSRHLRTHAALPSPSGREDKR